MRKVVNATLLLGVLSLAPLVFRCAPPAVQHAMPAPDPFLTEMGEVNRAYAREAEADPAREGEAQVRRLRRARAVYRKYGRRWPGP